MCIRSSSQPGLGDIAPPRWTTFWTLWARATTSSTGRTELKERLRSLAEKPQQPESADVGETLKQTLLMAQKAAEDARRNAEEKARLILENAEREAAAVLDRAQEKVRSQEQRLEDLVAQHGTLRARMKAMLEAYLEMLEDSALNLSDAKPGSVRDGRKE